MGAVKQCLIFWKEAWLKPVSRQQLRLHPNPVGTLGMCKGSSGSGAPSTRRTPTAKRDTVVWPRLLDYSTPLPWWDVRQYVEDYTSGNATLGRLFRGFVYVAYYNGSLSYRGRLGRPGRWLYDRLQAVWEVPFPRRKGLIPARGPTPTSDLNLRPGELVRVKPYEEIHASLDTTNHNRGMAFDAELVPYCGRNLSRQGEGKPFHRRKERKDAEPQDGGALVRRGLLPIPLQPQSDVLSTKHIFLVARDLA
jgi:hypothetical protein